MQKLKKSEINGNNILHYLNYGNPRQNEGEGEGEAEPIKP